jgi:hypothetical protein
VVTIGAVPLSMEAGVQAIRRSARARTNGAPTVRRTAAVAIRTFVTLRFAAVLTNQGSTISARRARKVPSVLSEISTAGTMASALPRLTVTSRVIVVSTRTSGVASRACACP